MEIRNKALVLAITPFKEKDAIVQLLCETQGHCSAMTRGFFTSRRRFGFAIDYFNLLNVGLRKGRSSMYTLSWAEPVRVFGNLRESLERNAAAMMLLSVVRAVAAQAPASPGGFVKVVESLGLVNDTAIDPWYGSVRGILDYLGCQGFSLTGGVCAGCGRSITEPVGLTRDGRPLCRACCGPRCRRLSSDFLAVLKGVTVHDPVFVVKDLEFFVQTVVERRLDIQRFLQIRPG